jgi:hypothetical protein
MNVTPEAAGFREAETCQFGLFFGGSLSRSPGVDAARAEKGFPL